MVPYFLGHVADSGHCNIHFLRIWISFLEWISGFSLSYSFDGIHVRLCHDGNVVYITLESIFDGMAPKWYFSSPTCIVFCCISFKPSLCV